MDNYIFISYSTKDIEMVNQLTDAINSCFIKFWKAPESIPAGGNYASAIPQGISNAKALVLVLSNNSQKSFWVESEVALAKEANLPIIAIQIEDVSLNERFSFLLSEAKIYSVYSIKNYNSDFLSAIKEINKTFSTSPNTVDVSKELATFYQLGESFTRSAGYIILMISFFTLFLSYVMLANDLSIWKWMKNILIYFGPIVQAFTIVVGIAVCFKNSKDVFNHVYICATISIVLYMISFYFLGASFKGMFIAEIIGYFISSVALQMYNILKKKPYNMIANVVTFDLVVISIIMLFAIH